MIQDVLVALVVVAAVLHMFATLMPTSWRMALNRRIGRVARSETASPVTRRVLRAVGRMLRIQPGGEHGGCSGCGAGETRRFPPG